MILNKEQIQLISKFEIKEVNYVKDVEFDVIDILTGEKKHIKENCYKFILQDETEYYNDENSLNKKWLEYLNKHSYRYITKPNRYKVLQRQKWNCNICSCKLKYSVNNKWEGEIAHIDHIHPFTKRESYPRGIDFINELSNFQALCPQCNLNKASKEIN